MKNNCPTCGTNLSAHRPGSSGEDAYFGKDCPKGKVQLEFIGCDREARHSEYGYLPVGHFFLEIYVDGQRFRIDVGTFEANTLSGKRRGLHVNFPYGWKVDVHSVNALDIAPDAQPDKEASK